jgi:hypothetical protein
MNQTTNNKQATVSVFFTRGFVMASHRVLPMLCGRTRHLPAAAGTHEGKKLMTFLMHLIHLRMQ